MNDAQQLILKQALLDLRTHLTAVVYDAMSFEQKLNSFNTTVASAVTWTTAPAELYKKVEYDDVIAYLTFREKILGIVDAEATNAFARELMFLANRLERFNMNQQTTTAVSVNRLLDGLISGALIDAQDKAIILSLANRTAAEAFGLTGLDALDIEQAEAL